MPIVAPYIQRKIKCPGHFLIPPHVDVFKREEVAELKGISKSTIDKYKLTTTRRAGLDWKKIYALEKIGIIKQPFISASYAIEHIYDPHGALCRQCDKRCMEGKGTINEYRIKRLHG